MTHLPLWKLFLLALVASYVVRWVAYRGGSRTDAYVLFRRITGQPADVCVTRVDGAWNFMEAKP